MAKREKKATVGERIADQFYPEGTMDHAVQAGKLSRRIDATIRRAVRETWAYATNDGSTPTNMWNRKHIAAKYGVNL